MASASGVAKLQTDVTPAQVEILNPKPTAVGETTHYGSGFIMTFGYIHTDTHLHYAFGEFDIFSMTIGVAREMPTIGTPAVLLDSVGGGSVVGALGLEIGYSAPLSTGFIGTDFVGFFNPAFPDPAAPLVYFGNVDSVLVTSDTTIPFRTGSGGHAVFQRVLLTDAFSNVTQKVFTGHANDTPYLLGTDPTFGPIYFYGADPATATLVMEGPVELGANSAVETETWFFTNLGTVLYSVNVDTGAHNRLETNFTQRSMLGRFDSEDTAYTMTFNPNSGSPTETVITEYNLVDLSVKARRAIPFSGWHTETNTNSAQIIGSGNDTVIIGLNTASSGSPGAGPAVGVSYFDSFIVVDMLTGQYEEVNTRTPFIGPSGDSRANDSLENGTVRRAFVVSTAAYFVGKAMQVLDLNSMTWTGLGGAQDATWIGQQILSVPAAWVTGRFEPTYVTPITAEIHRNRAQAPLNTTNITVLPK